jgi:hypothetical protein
MFWVNNERRLYALLAAVKVRATETTIPDPVDRLNLGQETV